MENLSFHLEGVVKSREEMQDFNGPLNLILMLLSKNKIEIRDIQISQILEQYLDYIDGMREMDLELASEFVQMASHLVYIKTKMLLTGDQEVSELEQLISSLEQLKSKGQYIAIKEALPGLTAAHELGVRYITKQPEPVRLPPGAGLSLRQEDLLAAIMALAAQIATQSETEVFHPKIFPGRIVFGVREKSRQLIELLRSRGHTSLSGLFAMCESRSELVATFISILELCSLGNIRFSQTEGDLQVSFSGGDVEEIIQAMEEAHDAGD